MISSGKKAKVARSVLGKHGIDCEKHGLYQEGDSDHRALTKYLFSQGTDKVICFARGVGIDLRHVEDSVYDLVAQINTYSHSDLSRDEIDFIMICQLLQEVCIWVDEQVRERLCNNWGDHQ